MKIDVTTEKVYEQLKFHTTYNDIIITLEVNIDYRNMTYNVQSPHEESVVLDGNKEYVSLILKLLNHIEKVMEFKLATEDD